MGSNKNRNALILLAAWSVFIMLASLWPADRMPRIMEQFSDKLEHLAAYAVLSFLAVRYTAIRNRLSIHSGRWFIYIFIFTTLYGTLLEIMQGLMFYGRTFDYLDMTANAAGSAVGIVIAWLLMVSVKKS